MKVERFSVLVAALVITGCSSSPSQLLKAGDPHVCAKSDVTKQLFDILKQHATNPVSDADAKEFGVNTQSWRDKLSLSIDNVTSNNVDKDNQKASCNGTVHVTASGVDGERSATINYDVSADLSSGDVIVQADASGAYPVAQMLALVAKPDLEKPLKQKADAAQARNDAVMAAEKARSPVSINIAELPNDDFSSRSNYTPLCQRGKPFVGAPCVVVDRTITKDHEQGLVQDFMDAAYLNATGEHPQTISLIYTYQTSGYFGANLRIHFQEDLMNYTLSQSDEAYFWVTTHDGGKTWSKIQQSTLRELSNP